MRPCTAGVWGTSVISPLDRLESLAGLARSDGFDVKPTLLRVLTDFYVQKAYHPPHEEQHFIELALRLIEEVDAPTLATVQRRLAHHEGIPRVVLERLAARLAAAAPARPQSGEPSLAIPSDVILSQAIASHTFASAASAHGAGPAAATAKAGATTESAATAHDEDSDDTDDSWNFLDTMVPDRQPNAIEAARAAVAPADRLAAARFSEEFFAADGASRRAILDRLDVAAAVPPLGISNATAALTTQRLEAAALKGRPYDFVREIERALAISRAITERIINDTSGELLLVIAKALAMPIDVVQRILLLLNPAIGTSIRRVFDLSSLYEDMSTAAALRMISLWRNAAEARQPEVRPSEPNAPERASAETARRRLARDVDPAPAPQVSAPLKRDQRAS